MATPREAVTDTSSQGIVAGVPCFLQPLASGQLTSELCVSCGAGWLFPEAGEHDHVVIPVVDEAWGLQASPTYPEVLPALTQRGLNPCGGTSDV